MDAALETRWISCAKCSRRSRPGQAFCELCGERVRDPSAEAEPRGRTLHCNGCGATVFIPETERTAACAFCGEPYVAAGETAPHRSPPEFVLPFSVSRKEAEAAFRSWLRERGWLTPGDLALKSAISKLEGVYVPFWSFSMRSDSDWQARIGEHWWETVTETYMATENGKSVMKTRTKRVQHTEWYPLAGRFHQFHSGCLVTASRGLKQALAEQVFPFPVADSSRYAPRFLSGWLCEEYTVERDEALVIAEKRFREKERDDIGEYLPGDTHADLEVETRFGDVAEDLVLLPFWIFAYAYGGKTYRFLANGATGRVHGERPWSGRRLILWILLLLAVVGILVLLGALLAHAA
jgi:hypothetical protein